MPLPARASAEPERPGITARRLAAATNRGPRSRRAVVDARRPDYRQRARPCCPSDGRAGPPPSASRRGQSQGVLARTVRTPGSGGAAGGCRAFLASASRGRARAGSGAAAGQRSRWAAAYAATTSGDRRPLSPTRMPFALAHALTALGVGCVMTLYSASDRPRHACGSRMSGRVGPTRHRGRLRGRLGRRGRGAPARRRGPERVPLDVSGAWPRQRTAPEQTPGRSSTNSSRGTPPSAPVQPRRTSCCCRA